MAQAPASPKATTCHGVLQSTPIARRRLAANRP